MKETYLGLGSNIGNREENLIRTVALIGSRFRVLDFSSIYITSPVGHKDQPYFFNMVIKIDSEEISPFDLLKYVKKTELELGRKRTFRWGPRVIDIDILFIDGVQIDTEELSIPHKELFKRNFVLIPLSEITDCITIDNELIYIKEFVRYNSDTTGIVSLYKSKENIVLYA